MTRSTHVMLATRQRGAALAIGLILLVVLTLLAFTGINAATTELAMAGNEQGRKNAAQASAAGVEIAIANLAAVPTVAGAAPVVRDQTLRAGSADRFRTSSVYVGDERGLPQSSVDKFVGLHFEIESTGRSLPDTRREGRDTQTQGVFVVTSSGPAGDPGSIRALPGTAEAGRLLP
jgi:type IV pilus assembly protein PilX